MLVTTDEPKWTRHHHPESRVYMGVAPGVACSVGLDTWKMTQTHRHNITQNIFAALKKKDVDFEVSAGRPS